MAANRPKRSCSSKRASLAEETISSDSDGEKQAEAEFHEDGNSSDSEDPEFDTRDENDRTKSGRKKKRASRKSVGSPPKRQRKSPPAAKKTPAATSSGAAAKQRSQASVTATKTIVNPLTSKGPMENFNFKHKNDGQYIFLLSEMKHLESLLQNLQDQKAAMEKLATHPMWRVEDDDLWIQKYEVESVKGMEVVYKMTRIFQHQDFNYEESYFVVGSVEDGDVKAQKEGGKEAKVTITYPDFTEIRDALKKFLEAEKTRPPPPVSVGRSGAKPSNPSPPLGQLGSNQATAKGPVSTAVNSNTVMVAPTRTYVHTRPTGKLTDEEMEAFSDYIQMMISHAVDRTFFPALYDDDADPDAVQEFRDKVRIIEEDRNMRMRTKLLNNWRLGEWMQDLCQEYPLFTEEKIQPDSGLTPKCSNCKGGAYFNNIYLEGPEYDKMTLLPLGGDPTRQRCAVFTMCQKCTIVVELYHLTTHMKFRIFHQCARKVAWMKFHFPDVKETRYSNELVHNQQHKRWLHQVQAPFLDKWGKMETNKI